MTAAQRFTDSVCLSIYGRLFLHVRKELAFYLEEALGIRGTGGKQVCLLLMDEDAGVAEKRRQLRDEEQRLRCFSERLDKLAMNTRAMAITTNSSGGTPGCSMDYEMI